MLASLHDTRTMQKCLLLLVSVTVVTASSASTDISRLMPTNNSILNEEEFKIENFELASKSLQYFLIVLYSLTAAFALLGNVLSIIVLTRGKRSSRDLRLFLVNLSLSDILMSIFSIPFTYTNFIMGRWIFAPETCPLVHSIQVISVFVSIYTLTIIGIDRYIAITRPFVVSFWSKSFAPIVVSLTWLLGLMLSMVIWFSSKAEPFITIHNITYYDCQESWSTKSREQMYTVMLFMVVFAIPLVCLIFFYGSICLKLWRHSAPGNANAVRDVAQNQAKLKVIKMLITIVALFAVCWFPVHLFQLIRVFDEEALLNFIGNDASSPRYLIIVISSHWLSMANSFVNPIIYCFMSDNFRTDLKNFAKKSIWRQRRARLMGNNSASNTLINQLPNQANKANAKQNNSTPINPCMEIYPLFLDQSAANSPDISRKGSANGLQTRSKPKFPCLRDKSRNKNSSNWNTSSQSSCRSNVTTNSMSASLQEMPISKQNYCKKHILSNESKLAETKT